jgi:hypothetical protein
MRSLERFNCFSYPFRFETRADGLVPSDGNRPVALPRREIVGGANSRHGGYDFS